ncbi:pyridoxal phosphate-dependent aminotransferase [Cognatishimia sp. WU-CL00825]|uniref:pyridoxal phosphate-dependent aminotransferase n=1 Tax=Cognatishimia sp. WU-CL00825 TaxID=3127658 RepID=UPI00310C7C12
MTEPPYTPLIQALPHSSPFTSPETLERARGAPFTARLGANESLFGPSPKAQACFADTAAEIFKYADSENHDLRHALAEFYAVQADNVVIGEGIDGLLGYTVRLFIAPGDRVVTSAGAYPTFNFHVAGYGGHIETVPYKNDQQDLAALIAKAKQVDAKLIYFCNPDNPMGSWHDGEKIAAQLDDIPEGCLLILDEAYVELAPPGTSPSYDISHPKVIRMRTFSKAYGMAGARIGYALGNAALIRNFEKVRNHFGINRASQAAALAALNDQGWLANVQDKTQIARAEIARIGKANGLTALPSATSFVTLDCHRDAAFAQAIVAGLADAGVFIRMPFVAPQNRCIRVSCGRPQDLAHFENALPKVLAGLR